MPYKREGTTVKVKKDGKWKTLKRYPSTAAGLKKAKAYLKALWANAHKG